MKPGDASASRDKNTPSITAQGEANVSRHATVAGRVNLGSFYTPAKYVECIAKWLKKHGVNQDWTIADLSCGYGAFFELAGRSDFSGCKFIGNDIDAVAVAKARSMFPRVAFCEKNALKDVNRKNFGISENTPLAIVGNPPYNDVTSQINQEVKTKRALMDEDIKSRDLGMASLLAYDKLKADCVAVLHPLSYLIKKANFSAARKFFSNYELLEHVIFSSQEFAGTSKLAGFPVLVALYHRAVGRGISYDDVRNMKFQTTTGDTFSINGFDYVSDHIEKYPHKRRYKQEILFYTLRDINALHRSRTFLNERTSNAVDVDPEKLPYYCYVDCFKRHAKTPYWMGNFNIPFLEKEFDDISEIAAADAKFHHPEIFGVTPKVPAHDLEKLLSYINESVYHKKSCNAPLHGEE